MTNRINPNPNYYSLAAKKRQKEVEERMALLNKIKEDAEREIKKTRFIIMEKVSKMRKFLWIKLKELY